MRLIHDRCEDLAVFEGRRPCHCAFGDIDPGRLLPHPLEQITGYRVTHHLVAAEALVKLDELPRQPKHQVVFSRLEILAANVDQMNALLRGDNLYELVQVVRTLHLQRRCCFDDHVCAADRRPYFTPMHWSRWELLERLEHAEGDDSILDLSA